MKSDNHPFLWLLYIFEDNIALKNDITRLIIVTDTQSWLISISSHNILLNSLISITSDSYTLHHFRHLILSLYVNTCCTCTCKQKKMSVNVSSSCIDLLNTIKKSYFKYPLWKFYFYNNWTFKHNNVFLRGVKLLMQVCI